MTALAGMAAPVMAATPSEFYANLLRRGVASYEANRYPDASRQLRIAAFGLVDVVDQYQLAQMYLALTHDKLGLKDRAQDAAQRVIVAERVERKYASVPVTPAVRSAFETLAARLLSPSDLAILRGGPIPPPPPQTTTTTTTRPATTAPQTATPPRTAGSQTATPPRGTTTAPQTTTPQTNPQQTSNQQASTPARPPATQPVISTPAPQATMPENTVPQTATPQTASQAVPAPAKPKPQPPPAVKPAVKPPVTTAATTTPSTVGGAETNGRGGPVEPARPAAPAPRPLTAGEITTRLAAAERALNGANLVEARRGYRELLAAPGLDHDTLIRVAEGLYRARDFAGALSAFTRLGALRRGEEPYRYYIAVAAYETGDYARAKKELAAALPYVEITADVARYRTRIEGAQ